MIWGEARMGAEAAALLGSPVWRGAGVARGGGRPVLLIPGFLAGDSSLGLMSQWLRRLGYRTHGSGITSNVECSERAVTKLEGRLIDLSERYGQPVSIIGHSRGGMFGRVLAVRHPDRVAHVVAMGSPLVPAMEDIHPLLRLQIRTLQRVQRTAGGGIVATGCELSFEAYNFGLDPIGCCTQFWTDLDDDVLDHVRFTSIYSRSDGVLHWRACLDPHADHVEVESSHCGMAFNRRVFEAVGGLLGEEPVVVPGADVVGESEPAPAPKRRPERAAATVRPRAERVATT